MSTLAPPAPPIPPGPPAGERGAADGRTPGTGAAPAASVEDPVVEARELPPWLVDCAGVVSLGMLALWGFVASFGPLGWVVGAVGLVVATAWTVVACAKGWPTWLVVIGGLVVYVVVGSILVVPDRAIAGVIPSPSSVTSLVFGAFTGWSSAVVTRPPIGRLDDLLAVPLVCGVLIGTVATALARRPGRVAFLAVVPAVVTLLGATAIGTDAPVSVLQGGLFAVVAVWWLAIVQRRIRSTGTHRARDRDRFRRLMVLLAVALIVGTVVGGTSAVSGSAHRVVLRDRAVPPVDERLQASPLAAFRHYKVDLATVPLFTVSGLRSTDAVRLATLDYYDGLVWQTTPPGLAADSSATFERVGSQLPVAPSTGTPRTVTVTVLGYQGVWLPSVGNSSTITFQAPRHQALVDGLRYDVVNGTLAEPDGLALRDSFSLTSAPTATPAPAQASVPSPPGILKMVQGSNDPWSQLVGVTTQLKKGVYSDAKPNQTPSDPGESDYRLTTFISQFTSLNDKNQEVGDAEQYAAVLALLARQLGLPARVVVGFRPSRAGTVTLVGSDMTAWVEVYHQAAWHALIPTPPATNDRIITKPPPPVQPTVVPLQPPPASPPAPLTRARPSKSKGPAGASDCAVSGTCPPGLVIPGWVAPTVGIPLGILALFAGVTLGLGGVKRSRRNRRRSGGTPAAQVGGGWDELCDLIRDTGGILPANATRRESAVLIDRSGVALAAQRTDALTFGPDEVTPEAASSHWRDIEAARSGILASLSRFDRWKAMVSLSSLQVQSRIEVVQHHLGRRVDDAVNWARGLVRKVAR